MALQPGDTLEHGKYRIVRQLGRGGFGFVYLAEDALLREEAAIKELIPALVGDEAALKRFLAEAKATMRLTHERIVRTHNVFVEAGNYYIAMEYMPGGSLETRLQAQSTLPVEQAVRIAADVAEGLAYAHERGVVHCDLKPANILFAADGRVKIGDFGIAHVSGETLTRTWLTPAGFVAGTLPYMSPEQADGVRDDPRIDVYALGAVLYRVLTGQPYLEFEQRETPGAQSRNVQRIQSQVPSAPSGYNRSVPGWLDAVVLKALRKLPDERFARIAEMRAALLRRVEPAVAPSPEVESGTITVPPRRLAPAPTASRRRLPAWLWPTVGAAAVLLAVALVLLAWGGGRGNGRGIITSPEPVLASAAVTWTPSPTGTRVPLPTPTLTASPPPSPTGTSAPSTAQTLTPTVTASPTDTPAPIPTPTLTATPTPTASPTSTFVPTRTPTASPPGPLPRDQVLIPRGRFVSGSTADDIRRVVDSLCAAYSDKWCVRSSFEDELIQDRSVFLADFSIDRFEVTNEMYAACVKAGACDPPRSDGANPRATDYRDGERARFPVIYVTWHDADRYCRWAGARLPTAAEWEKAARGADGDWWPWGDESPTTQANFRSPGQVAASQSDETRRGGDTARVGSYPADVSPYGAADMAGNVMEWVDSWYSSSKRELRGGSWNTSSATTRTASRTGADPSTAYFDVGFRCAQSGQQ